MFNKKGKYEAETTAAAQKYAKQSKKSNLLSAYFTSLLCLILCATMFLSTSMAWFTSEVNNAGNEIYVGTLGVKLYNGEKEIVDGSEPILEKKTWQPGTMVIERFKIENTGTLAFTYRLSMSMADWATAEERERVAANAITVWVCEVKDGYADPVNYETMVEKATDTGWKKIGTLADVLSGQSLIVNTMNPSESVMTAADDTAVTPVGCEYAVALHMDTDASSESMGAKLDNITIKLVASQLGSDVLYIPADQTFTLSGVTHPLTVYGEGTLALNDVTINGTEETHPNALNVAGNIKVVVTGETTLTGATGGSGIYVSAGSVLELSGTGNLKAVGNGGAEDTSVKFGGHGIGGEGTINIHDLASLTAEGWGHDAFGIGGNTTKIDISDTTITYVKGGYVQPNFVNDTSYGKSEPEGGAAIGSSANGAEITLTRVIINKAEGGSKAAGIGAQYHTGVTINIDDCTFTEVIGGNASAGIGGSRISKNATTVENVKINIADSTITAKGGEFGAGIGSGYNTYCQLPGPVCTINITGGSVITAAGGKYAAGIGTGYHVAGLAGKIESGVKIEATSGGSREKYTVAMGVGFGVIDHAKEAGEGNTSSFDYQGTTITVASAQLVNNTTTETTGE